MPGRRFRAIRLALNWGLLWGAALGFWLLAPRFLWFHHILPGTLSEWLTFVLALSLALIVNAAVCSVFATFPLIAWETIRGRHFAEPSWAYGIGVGFFLVPTYICYATFIVWVAFGSSEGIRILRLLLETTIAPLIALSLVSLLVYRRLTAQSKRLSASWLAVTLLVATFLGLAALPYRTAVPSGPEVIDVDPPTHFQSGRSEVAPLLFIGIDSANWRVLRPLIDQRRLPVLAKLTSEGIRGTITALWPPYWSGPAWAAIVTGHSIEETKIYEDLVIKGPGLLSYQVPIELNPALTPFTLLQYLLVRTGVLQLSPPPRSMLKRPPFWELLARSGVKTAVVRFPFTFPANGQADVVISDSVGYDGWTLAGVEPSVAPIGIFPATIADDLLGSFSKDAVQNPQDVATFLQNPDSPRRADAQLDPIAMLRLALSIDRKTVDASMRILKAYPDLRVLAVYLGGFDTICHAFWWYRFAEDFTGNPPDPRDVNQLGQVIDRYLEFLDRELGRLTTGFSARPNVIVVSDHGYEANSSNVLFKGQHSPAGIFIAAGPGVPRRTKEFDVSYYDVVPTIMELLDFAQPDGARGTSLLNQ